MLNEILISLETLEGTNNDKEANTFTISFLGIKYDVNKLKHRASRNDLLTGGRGR